MSPAVVCATLMATASAAPVADAGRSYNACIRCHENLPGRLSGVVHQWRQSVHYANQVTCDGCHGGDPSIRREQVESEEAFKERSHLRRDNRILDLYPSNGAFTASVRGRNVSYFCGKCHALIKEKHLGSPHGDLGAPTCLYCHGQGSHAIQPSTVDIIDTRREPGVGRCATCHRAATMETVSNIKNILADAQQQIATAGEQYNWLEEHGYKNLELERMFHHSRETLSQLRRTFHSFNMREINNFASAIQDNADRTEQTYELVSQVKQNQHRQAIIGAAAVVFLLLFAGLLQYYRRSVLNHEAMPHRDGRTRSSD